MSDFYNKYPYTDFHELNLDWVIERVKKLTEDWAATSQEWDSTEQAWNDLHDYVMNYFNNLDVQDEINHKLDIMASDGTLDALLLPYFNTYKTEINGIIADQNQAIETLSTRVTEIASLPEGSTSGDAELIDIRTPATGFNLNQAYTSAGDSVRGQITNLHDRIDQNSFDMFEALTGLKPLELIPGQSISTSGSIVPSPSSNNLIKSCKVSCSANDLFYIYGTGGSSARLWAFADTDNNILSAATSGASLSGGYITAPASSAYIVINITLASAIGCCFKVDRTHNNIMPTKYLHSADIVNAGNLPINDVNTILSNEVYGFSSTVTQAMVDHLPKYGTACILFSPCAINKDESSKFSLQFAYYLDGTIYLRNANMGAGPTYIYGSWTQLADVNYIANYNNANFVVCSKGNAVVSGTPVFNDANLITTSGVYFIGSSVTSGDIANLPKYGTACVFINMITKNSAIYVCYQIVKYFDGDYFVRYLTHEEGAVGYIERWKTIMQEYDIIVDINGSGNFTSLSAAIEHVNINQIKNAHITILPGIYDIYNEFIALKGATYFDDLASNYKAGNFLTRDIILDFLPGAVVTFTYIGGNANVYEGFSPFNAMSDDNGGFTMIGADIRVSNCRYCVHDEHDGTGSYHNVYKNCRMSIDNSANSYFAYAHAIGGGLGTHSLIDISECEFTNGGSSSDDGICVSYHNGNNANAESRISFHNNVCIDGTFKALNFGPSSEQTYCYVSNNLLASAPEKGSSSAPGVITEDNMTLIDWNNAISA